MSELLQAAHDALESGLIIARETNTKLVHLSVEDAKTIYSVLFAEPKTSAELEGGGTCWYYVCDECHIAINPKDNYCRGCGRKIIWE